MALLTIDDPLAEGLELSANEFLLAAARAQAIAEGKLGANRRLEKQIFHSTLRLNNGVCYLPQRPVDVNEPITVHVLPIKTTQMVTRVTMAGLSYGNTFGRDDIYGQYQSAPIVKERSLPESQSHFEPATSKLTCFVSRSAHTPLSSTGHLSVRVSYTAGYDFSVGSTDVDAIAMKAALVALIKADVDSADGITDFRLDDFYSIKVDGDAVRDRQQSALEIFRAYAVG